MADIRPKDLLPGTPTDTAALIFDSGAVVQKATPTQLVNAATPLASQAEAEAGTNNVKRVTPLRVSQAIAALALPPLAASTGAASVGKAGTGTVQDTISLLEGVSVAPSISGTFIGDGSTSKFGVNMVLNGTSTTQNEIGFSVTIDNAVATGGGKAYSVGAFSASTARAGSCTGYGFNSIFRSYGPPGTSNEANTDNFGPDSGNADNENSIYGAYTWVTIGNDVAAGTNKCLAGRVISSPPSYPKILNRGLLIDGDCIAKNGIEDTSNAAIGYKSTGTKGVGMDFTGLTVTSQKVMAFASGQFLNWVVGGTPQQVIGVSGTSLQIGYGTAQTLFGSSLIPGANNAFTIGGPSSASVSNIYSQNAVTVTSDLREKNVIGDLRDEMDVRAFVRNIRAILYRYKVGENEPQIITEPGMVVAKGADGLDIIDQIPVFGDDGEPVMVEVPDWEKMPKRDGEQHPRWQLGDPTKLVQQTRGEPRMVEGMVERTIYVPRAGLRPHAGFIAQDFEAELERQAVDCGVFVRKEDGSLGLRDGQEIPFVWEVCNFLMDDFDALDRRISAIEART